MDALKGFFLWPLYVVTTYTQFWAVMLINSPAFVARIANSGVKSIAKIGDLHDFCKTLYFGNVIMSGVVGMYAPYSASVGASIDDLTHDTCTVSMRDYPWLRNPFQSLHAVAMINIGEMASGVIMVKQLENHRHIKGIPVKISAEYFKKARGKITAKGSVSLEVVCWVLCAYCVARWDYIAMH